MVEEKNLLKWKGQLGVIIRHNEPAIKIRIDTEEQRVVEVTNKQAEVLLRQPELWEIVKKKKGEEQ